MPYFGGYFGGGDDGGETPSRTDAPGLISPELRVYQPFTIHQGEYALYRADAEGEAIGQAVYLGGKFEDLSPEQTFVGQRIDAHGSPYGRTVHVDERHSFTVRNLWAIQRGRNVLPAPTRNQQYVFVVVFYDEQTKTFAKRIYFGVTADGQKLPTDDQVVRHQVPFSAGYMVEQGGIGIRPDLTAQLLGEIRYVTPAEEGLLYYYDFATDTYVAPFPADLEGRAKIVNDLTQFRVNFDLDGNGQGIPALKVTSDKLRVNELTGIGGTFLLGPTTPRIEWWYGARRMASLSGAGELSVPDIVETLADPQVRHGFKIRVGGVWAATIGPNKTYAKEFAEVLLSGEIRYATEVEDRLLYRYYPNDAGLYGYRATDAALIPGRAELISDPSQFRIDFNGTAALLVTADELQVHDITARGNSELNGASDRRLEWWSGGTKHASLSAAGELAIPDLEETDTPVADEQGFLMAVNGGWAASIGLSRAFAREFSEFLGE